MKVTEGTQVVPEEEGEEFGPKPELGLFFTAKLLGFPEPTPGQLRSAAAVVGEQFALFDRVRRGTPEERLAARQQLVVKNQGLVGRITNKYHWRSKVVEMQLDRALELGDLFQEGVIGLMRAIETYDYTSGNRFSTYAMWWIRQAVTRAFEDRGPVRVPVHMREALTRFFREIRTLTKELGRAPTLVEMKEHLELTDKRFQSLLFALFYYGQQKFIRLDQPARADGESDTPMHDILTVEKADETDLGEEFVLPHQVMRSLRNRQLTRYVQDALEAAALTRDEKLVIIRRYGLDGNDEETLREIADRLGLSYQRILQFQVKGIAKLRDPELWKRLVDVKKRPPLDPYAPLKEPKPEKNDDSTEEAEWGGMPWMAETFVDFATSVVQNRQLMSSERDIVVRREGLDGQPAETVEQIATRLGIPTTRVEQLESKARQKLRNPSSSADRTKRAYLPSSSGIAAASPTPTKRQAVTVEKLGSLAETFGDNVDVQDLVSVVVSCYSVEEKDLMTSAGEERLVRPRQVLVYLLREHTAHSYGSIATMFGWPETGHASRAYRECRDTLADSEELRGHFEQLYQALSERLRHRANA